MIIVSLLTACSSGSNVDTSENKITKVDTKTESINPEASDTIEKFEEEQGSVAESSESPVDIDVTSLSSTMIAAELFNVQRNMPDYIGKTIKLKGKYNEYYDSYYERTIHLVYAMDEGGCCPIEFEIVLPEGESYPQKENEIEIFGKISSDTSADYTNYYIETLEIKNLST